VERADSAKSTDSTSGALQGIPIEDRSGHVGDFGGGGWVTADQLRAGDTLAGLDGELSFTVLSSTREERPQGILVYNLTVEGDHTYYVADSEGQAHAVWAHNARTCPWLLRTNMKDAGVKFQTGEMAAHVVPHGEFSLRNKKVREAIQKSKNILERNGIDLDDAVNGFATRSLTHNGTHRNKYFTDMADRLSKAEKDGPAAVVKELGELKRDALNGKCPDGEVCMRDGLAMYELESELEDPRFEGFGMDAPSLRGNRNRLDDFLPDKITDARWQAPRMASTWTTPRVDDSRVRKFNDYPAVLTAPVFSERAVRALRDLLEPNGELLPLESKLGNYWIYNITTVADVVDPDRSVVNWIHRDWRLSSTIDRYEVFPERLESLAIFRIIEDPPSAFVTDVFVERARAAGLQGMNFIKTWPMPPGVIWWELERDRGLAKENSNPFTGQSMVIRLGLRGRPAKGGPDEHAAIDRLLDELDAMLAPSDSRELIGSLEGHEYLRRECRLFLSCPDADALFERLRPWLRGLNWPGEVAVLKRYGHYRQKKAPEVYVDP
jgi:hypothetical protein